MTPNNGGLPGLSVLGQIVGALMWGPVACVAALVVWVIMSALGHHGDTYAQTTSGKTGDLVSASGAVLIGGANPIAAVFSGLGAGIQ